jgi:hypothetical protein
MNFCLLSIHKNPDLSQRGDLKAVGIRFALGGLCASIFDDRRRDKSVEQGTAFQGEEQVDGS